MLSSDGVICWGNKRHPSMRIFSPLVVMILLMACANPARLIEQGKYARALEVSSRQLKNGRIKAPELAALEASFYLLTQQDSQQVVLLRSSGRPDVWPEIYQLAVRIKERQNKLEALKNDLSRSGYFPGLNFYPATALEEEAAQKSALFHYANAQEFIPAARKGDRKLARTAYEEITRSLSYISDFRDAVSLQLEMRERGITHLLLRPGTSPAGPYFMEPDYLNALYWGHHFPEQYDWLVIHDDRASAPVIHFEMDFYFDNLSVGFDQETTSSCSNSVEVADGFTLKKVWSEQDSAYIEIQEIRYKTVTATVMTVAQSKEADAQVQILIYDPRNGKLYLEDRLYGSADWSNVYTKTFGDDRALSSSCPGVSGFWCPFPSDGSLLEDAVEDLNFSFWQRVSEVEDF